jgi:hypothetical protein
MNLFACREYCCLRNNNTPAEQTGTRFRKPPSVTFFSGLNLSVIHAIMVSYILRFEIERPSVRNYVPAGVLYILQISSVNQKRANGLSILPISEFFRIAPSIEMLTCLSNGLLECWPRRSVVSGSSVEGQVLLQNISSSYFHCYTVILLLHSLKKAYVVAAALPDFLFCFPI